MKSWPKKMDYFGAYLMLALVITWSTNLDLEEIIQHAKARKAELDSECRR